MLAGFGGWTERFLKVVWGVFVRIVRGGIGTGSLLAAFPSGQQKAVAMKTQKAARHLCKVFIPLSSLSLRSPGR